VVMENAQAPGSQIVWPLRGGTRTECRCEKVQTGILHLTEIIAVNIRGGELNQHHKVPPCTAFSDGAQVFHQLLGVNEVLPRTGG
jgi:hypothetical protein